MYWCEVSVVLRHPAYYYIKVVCNSRKETMRWLSSRRMHLSGLQVEVTPNYGNSHLIFINSKNDFFIFWCKVTPLLRNLFA